jgi:hypothetical protein
MKGNGRNSDQLHNVPISCSLFMQVIEEDGGRLNAFAKEPRMEVISEGASLSNGSRLLIISGAVLVIALMALSVAVS